MILKLIQKTAREANSEFVIATNSVIAYFYDPGLRHLTLYTAYQAFKFTDADLSHLN